MTTGCKTTTVFVTVLCALLLTILGLVQEWPAWVWPVLAVLLIGIPAAAFKVASARRGPVPVVFEEQITAAPFERREQQVTRVALPSQWDDYDFQFSATVRWYPLDHGGDDRIVNPAGLAVEAVLDRARAITEQREPGRASLVQHELSGALSRMRPEGTGHLQVMAEDVTLVLREHDQERLDRLAEVRKDKAVWEHQRKYEQSKREYLGEDVLKDTGSAVVWWLAKNDDHVEKTVADLDLLARLTSAANDTEIPERLRDMLAQPSGERPVPFEREPTAADHFEAFINSMDLTDDDVRRFVAKQIAEVIRAQVPHATAEEMLRRYDPPADFTADDENEPTSTPPEDPDGAAGGTSGA
ncbi:hypothetical protein [Streptomyces olivaceiscleroticus]|uniref:Band 7 domain-containing protein n=1 Tax=Streptomyces olivaceiscleroticus TaxID=68245 RepID=A0ABP3LH46_9ACTN